MADDTKAPSDGAASDEEAKAAEASPPKDTTDATDARAEAQEDSEAESSEAESSDAESSDAERSDAESSEAESSEAVAEAAPPAEAKAPPAEAKASAAPEKATDGAPMIEAIGLSKFYGRFAAIRDVSFSIPKGQVVAFLGPNGAGKSTTMKILTGFLAPSQGRARINGIDVGQNRLEAARSLGYMPENGPLYADMTPRALLEFMAEIRGYDRSYSHQRIGQVVRQCHLTDVLEKPIAKLSKGYRQRVGMAQAFLHDPDVLILDEPTSGLDPNQIADVRRNIIEAGARKTILLSTHILQEVEAMADRVIFIYEGRVVFDGPKDEFCQAGQSMDERFHELTRPEALAGRTQ